MATDFLEDVLACPACRGPVERDDEQYACSTCARRYPVRYGIPDFRLEPDPYISIEAEIAKIEGFNAPGRSFADMVRAYYVLTPESPPHLHQRYMAAMDAAVTRGAGILSKLQAKFPGTGTNALLDLGCGTGGLSMAGARCYANVIGADVALRWLVMGKRRLEENGVEVPLVCANAESLPFRDRVFDAVAADAVLEHVRDSSRMRDEVVRTLRPRGAWFFVTNNRFSMLPEPHVRILGFGLIPRRYQETVSWALRQTPYRARLHSRRELRRLFRGVGEVLLPYFGEGELGAHNERLRSTWDKLTHVPLFSRIFGAVVPQYFIVGQKSSDSGAAASPHSHAPHLQNKHD